MKLLISLLVTLFLFAPLQAKEFGEYGSVDRSVNSEQLECDDILLVTTDESGSSSVNSQRWETGRHVTVEQLTGCVIELAQFGAVADGSTNNDVAISDWIAAAVAVSGKDRENRPILTCSQGHYSFDTPFNIPAFIDVYCEGAFFNYDGTDFSQSAISWGTAGTNNEFGIFRIKGINNTTGDGTHPNKNWQSPWFAGIEIIDTDSSYIEVGYADNFYVGMQLTGDTVSVFKNQIKFGNGINLNECVRLYSRLSSDAFLNGNDFIVGPNCTATSSSFDKGNSHGFVYTTELSFNYDGESGGPFTENESIYWDEGFGAIDVLTDGGATGTITFILANGELPEDNDVITGVSSGATANVNGSTSTSGYTGHNKNTIYSPTFQPTISNAWVATTAVTQGERRHASNGYLYEAGSTATTGSTEPTHVTGSASDGTVSWRFLGYAHRSPVFYNHAGTDNAVISARWESGYGPAMVVSDADLGQGTTFNITNTSSVTDHPILNSEMWGSLSDDLDEAPVSVSFTKTRAHQARRQLIIDDIEQRIITGTSNVITASKGIVFIRIGGAIRHDNTETDADFRHTRHGVYVSGNFGIGVLVDAETSRGWRYRKISYPGGIDPRYISTGFDRNFEFIADPGGTNNPLRMAETSQTSYASSVLRVADSSADNDPKHVYAEDSVGHVLLGMNTGHTKGIDIQTIPGMTAEMEQESITIQNRFSSVEGPRTSQGTPIAGFFLDAGEYIANTNTAASQPYGWFVDDPGILANAAANSTSYVFEELAEDGGQIYYKKSAGTEICGTDTITTLTGTNPATELTDDAGCVWVWVDSEATLTATTQTR